MVGPVERVASQLSVRIAGGAAILSGLLRDARLLRRTQQSVLNATAEEEGGAIGINPPDHRPNSKRWALRRYDLELYGRSDPEPSLGSDLCAKPADVHTARQVAGCSRVNDDGPGDTSSGKLPSVLRLRGVHVDGEQQLVYQSLTDNGLG